jgi:hypothetical protein
MTRWLAYLFSLVFIFCTGFYVYLLWENNRQIEPPTLSEIQGSLNDSIKWLVQHEEDILDDNNSMLWWMLQQSAAITGAPRLQKLFDKYEARYLKNSQGNLWRPLFVDNTWVPVRYEDISSMPYYNKHFIYAMTCDEDLGRHPEIAAQNDADFCDAHPLRPACATHQLMGIRIMQRKGCGDQEQLANTVKLLQERIERQLTFDPRVVDVYLQRVLMLVESGAIELVKPIWLRHVLDAQSDDGGWGNFEVLLPFPNGYSVGFSGHGLGFKRPKNGFHTTAQGVFIMSLVYAITGNSH